MVSSTGADHHAREKSRIVGCGEQGGGGADVRSDHVRRLQAGLGNQGDQECSHRSRRQELLPALGPAETWKVDGEDAGAL
jgi:hypothetical protein